MKIYVDTSGNDYGESNILHACEEFLSHSNHQEVRLKVYISSQNTEIKKHIESMDARFNHRITFVNCNKSLSNNERYKRGDKSTTEKALLDMYSDPDTNCAFISCINIKHITLIAFGLDNAKLNGIPSTLVQAIPTLCGTKRIMLDLGASIDPNLFTLGLVAKAFISTFFDISTPKIAFLNIGSESNKGLPSVIQTALDYKTSVGQEFTYGKNGFIEPDEILLDNHCNAVVCSGLHGNIAIKSFKSVTKVMSSIMKENRLKAIFAYPALSIFNKKFNYDLYNGALITRFSRLMIKAHGSSSKMAFVHALCRITNMFMPKFNIFYNVCSDISKDSRIYAKR